MVHPEAGRQPTEAELRAFVARAAGGVQGAGPGGLLARRPCRATPTAKIMKKRPAGPVQWWGKRQPEGRGRGRAGRSDRHPEGDLGCMPIDALSGSGDRGYGDTAAGSGSAVATGAGLSAGRCAQRLAGWRTSAPPDPAAMSARLAELAVAAGARRRLNGGAVEALERLCGPSRQGGLRLLPDGHACQQRRAAGACGEARVPLCQYDSHLYRDESNMRSGWRASTGCRWRGRRADPGGAGRGIRRGRVEAPCAQVRAILLESPVRRLDGQPIPQRRIAEIAALAAAQRHAHDLDARAAAARRPRSTARPMSRRSRRSMSRLYKYLERCPGRCWPGRRLRSPGAREWRRTPRRWADHQGWAPGCSRSTAAAPSLESIAKAHGTAEVLFAALERSGRRSAGRTSTLPTSIGWRCPRRWPSRFERAAPPACASGAGQVSDPLLRQRDAAAAPGRGICEAVPGIGCEPIPLFAIRAKAGPFPRPSANAPFVRNDGAKR